MMKIFFIGIVVLVLIIIVTPFVTRFFGSSDSDLEVQEAKETEKSDMPVAGYPIEK